MATWANLRSGRLTTMRRIRVNQSLMLPVAACLASKAIWDISLIWPQTNMPLKKRDELYPEAQKVHPERWSGKTRNWQPQGPVTLNPKREKQAA